MIKEHPVDEFIPLHRFAVLYALLRPSLATTLPMIARVHTLVQQTDCAKRSLMK